MDCAGRAAADDAALAQHVPDQRLRLRPLVGVEEAPLPPAAEPDAPGLSQHFQIFRVFHVFQFPSGEHSDILGAGLLEHGDFAVAGGNRVGLSGRQNDDRRVGPAGRLDEFAEDWRGHPSAADDDERSVWHLGDGGRGGREGRPVAGQRRAPPHGEVRFAVCFQRDRSGRARRRGCQAHAHRAVAQNAHLTAPHNKCGSHGDA